MGSFDAGNRGASMVLSRLHDNRSGTHERLFGPSGASPRKQAEDHRPHQKYIERQFPDTSRLGGKSWRPVFYDRAESRRNRLYSILSGYKLSRSGRKVAEGKEFADRAGRAFPDG